MKTLYTAILSNGKHGHITVLLHYKSVCREFKQSKKRKTYAKKRHWRNHYFFFKGNMVNLFTPDSV